MKVGFMNPKSKSVFKNFFFVLSLFCLIICAFFSSRFFLEKSSGEKEESSYKFDPREFFLLTKPVNFLILGTDEKYERESYGYAVKIKNSLQGRSDVLIVCQVNPLLNRVTFLHIPRDTKVFINGQQADKINMLNLYGGPELVKRSVGEILDLKIDFYLLLNLEKIKEFIDLIDGIKINVPKSMRYQDKTAGLKINLKQGKQTLNGEEAVAFLRYRKDILGDINRIQRQQMFIEAVQNKLKDPKLVTKIPYLVSKLSSFLVSDTSQINLLKILSFIKSKEKELEKVRLTLPGSFSVPEYQEDLVSETIDLAEFEDLPQKKATKKFASPYEEQEPPDTTEKTEEKTEEKLIEKIMLEKSCDSFELAAENKLICYKKIRKQKAFTSYWLPDLPKIRLIINRSFNSRKRKTEEKASSEIYINIEKASKDYSSIRKITNKLRKANFSKIEISKLTFEKNKSAIYAQKANRKEAEIIRKKAGLNSKIPIKLASAGLPHSDVVIVVGEDIREFFN